MVKTRHAADPSDESEDEVISHRHRSTRRHRMIKSKSNGFDDYRDEDSASTDYGSGLGTHSKAGTAAVSARPQRTRKTRALRQVIEEEEDEDMGHKKPGRPKSSPKTAISPIMRRRTRRYAMGETTDEDEEEEEQRPMKYTLRRSVSQPSTTHVSHEDKSIRRSTRQKKLLYCTFNQNLIEKHQMLMGEEGGDDVDSERGRAHRKRKRSSEVEPMLEQDGLDMYSRVKRIRRQVKRDIYGMPVLAIQQQEGSSSVPDSSEDEEEDETEEEEDRSERRTYHLRVHKPRTNLYEAPPIVSQKRPPRGIFRGDTPPRRTFNTATYRSPAHKSPRFRSKKRGKKCLSSLQKKTIEKEKLDSSRKRHAFHGSSSTSSSSGSDSDDERQFERRKAKSMARNRNRCLPMNFTGEEVTTGIMRDRTKVGTSLADVDPMSVDKGVTFESVGGLCKHISALKEMIIFPLLYPEVFERFRITPPRGVLFYGPPGTGKTLVARALANECSNENRKVAFFMRKGADCLSKWVGESERQLRLLFDQAYQMRPSIIFFDEIDGLAPVRSSRQDQIHSSIVSTLLALMDGLDSRGEIVIIGATNRIDSIDPALRRPGRFDREFLFPLPTVEARKQILEINTKEWNPKLCDTFLTELAERCVGYCGADLKSLCTEGALHALRRRFPQIYTSEDKLELDVSAIEVQARDFSKAMDNIVPASQRSVSAPGRALDKIIRPLLISVFQKVIVKVKCIFPMATVLSNTLDASGNANSETQYPLELCSDDEDEDAHPISEFISQSGGKKRNSECEAPPKTYLNFSRSATQKPMTYRPRLLLSGHPSQGQSTHLGPAVLHYLERVPVHVLDLPSLYAVTTHTPEEACAQIFREARRTSPSIVYMPHIGEWWQVINETLQATFLALLYDLDPAVPIMLIATSEMRYSELPRQIKCLFCAEDVVVMKNPTEHERRDFFKTLLLHEIKRPPSTRKVAASRILEILPKARPVEPRKLTDVELKSIQKHEEKHLRELRLFLRDILNKLGRDRKFAIFAKPVDTEDVPDYYEIIKIPMDLSTMMTKIDLHQYESVKGFLEDINCICSNALEYNPDHDSAGRAIRHRACALRDTCQALIEAELDPDFEKICEEIKRARLRRGEPAAATVPAFYYTKPIQMPGTALGSQAAYPARFCRDRMHISSAQIANNEPKIRAIVKKVRVTVTGNTKSSNKNKSPWCRTRRRHFKKVIVYVDEFGNEVPPPGSPKRPGSAKDSDDGHDSDKTIELGMDDNEMRKSLQSSDRTGDTDDEKEYRRSNSSPTYSGRKGGGRAATNLNLSEQKPKIHAIIKRVSLQPSTSSRHLNRKKSPWCRSRRKKRRFKKVIVYVDEFGNEVPPPASGAGRENGTLGDESNQEDEDNDLDSSKEMERSPKMNSKMKGKENKPLKRGMNSPGSKASTPKGTPNLRSLSGPSKRGRSPTGVLTRNTSPHSTSTRSAETPRKASQCGSPRIPLKVEEKSPCRRRSRSGASEAMSSSSKQPASPKSNSSLHTFKHVGPQPSTSLGYPVSSSTPSTPSPRNPRFMSGSADILTAEVGYGGPMGRMTRSRYQVPAAIEAMAKQVLEADVPDSVIINDSALYVLLAKTVAVTDNATVEHLEKVYCRLSQAIFAHREHIDKSRLVQDLEHIISSLSTNHHSSSSSDRC